MLEFPPVPYLQKQSFSNIFISAEWDKMFGILIDVLILQKYEIQKERVHLSVLDRNTGAGQCVTELTTSPCLVSFPEAMSM